ncbi:MAG: TonB-dependent receptor plug domain-containing protein [Bacteroidales bacterium]|nr:TonB-dependent receptor plug domain-containing protein [Bacteroidales bacterium]
MEKRIFAAALAAFTAAAALYAGTDGAKQLALSPADIIEGTEVGVSVSALDGNPNASKSVIIRGVNTLRGDSQPLWIVDGVILGNAMNKNLDMFYQHPEKSYTTPLNMMAFLDPEEIESIEVIKDVSATALYGALGANGVIIIKTKKAGASPMSFDWTSNVGVGFPSVKADEFKPGINHNHSLRVHGTNSNTTYSIGAFLRDNHAVVKGTGNTFGGLNVSLESTGNPLVSIGMNTSLAIGKMVSALGASYFGEGSTMLAARNPGQGSVTDWLQGYDDKANDFRVISSVWVNVNLGQSLKWRTTLGVDYEDMRRGIWYGSQTPFGKEVNSAASQFIGSMFSYNLETGLNYSRYFAGVHGIKAHFGIGLVNSLNTFNTLAGTDFFTEELRAKGISIASSERPIHRFEQALNQYFAALTLSYDWASKVGVDGNIRLDAAPRYDDWKPTVYGGANAWWDIRNTFFSDSKVLSSVKASLGYGRAGSRQYVPYRLLGNYTTGGYVVAEEGTEEFYEGLNSLDSRELSASLNLSFCQGRYEIRLTRYVKTTDDILSTYCFGKSNGKLWERSSRTNLSEQKSRLGNSGWEIEAGAMVLRTGDMSLKLNANVAICRNAVISLAASDIYGKKIGREIYCNMNAVGYPVGSLVGVETGPDGSLLDVTGDGKIKEEDKQIIGNPFPKVHGGFGAEFTVKGFSIDLLATGAAGFDIMNLNSLYPVGEETPVISRNNLEKGDWLRLSRISASYLLPIKKNLKIKEVKLTLSALDLLTISSYKGWNPAVNCFGSSTLSSGIDYGSFPVQKSIVVGVSAKF